MKKSSFGIQGTNEVLSQRSEHEHVCFLNDPERSVSHDAILLSRLCMWVFPWLTINPKSAVHLVMNTPTLTTKQTASCASGFSSIQTQ